MATQVARERKQMETHTHSYLRLILRTSQPELERECPRQSVTCSHMSYQHVQEQGEITKVLLACKASQALLNADHFCSFLILEGKPMRPL